MSAIMAIVVVTSLVTAAIALALRAGESLSCAARGRRSAAEAARAGSEAANERLWQSDPLAAMAPSWYALQPELGLRRAETEAARTGLKAASDKRQAYVDEGRHGSAWTRWQVVVTAVLSLLWVVVFGLQVLLDYKIIRAVHPGDVLVAIGLGLVVAAAVTGTALRLAVAMREHEQSRSRRRYWLLFGGAFLVMLVAVLAVIAPARSEQEFSAELAHKEKALAVARSDGDRATIGVAETDLAAVRGRLERGRDVDRVSALVVPVAEAILSPFAISGATLALLGVASLGVRRRQSQVARAQAHEQALVQMWIARTSQQLNEYTRGQEWLATFLGRLQERPRLPQQGALSTGGAPAPGDGQGFTPSETVGWVPPPAPPAEVIDVPEAPSRAQPTLADQRVAAPDVAVAPDQGPDSQWDES